MLGPLEVTDGLRLLPTGGYRQRLVLAVLLSRPNEVLATDWLVEAVWGDEPPRTARKTLQAYLTRLRHLLGEDAITTVPDGYRLTAGAETLDALRFERMARDGRASLTHDPTRAAGLLHQALDMWRGSAFGDLGDVPALVAATRRLHEQRVVAIEDRLEADLSCGHGSDLVAEAADLVESHPLRERLRAHLMLALYRAGRQAEALACYEQLRTLLADELGADPAESVRTLYERILRHDPSLDAASGVSAASDDRDIRNPYKGLRAFTENDADDFYGRDDLIDELEAAVRSRPLVAVVGASGSGKSSAVVAGLVPRLRGAEPAWLVVTLTPGVHPFEHLMDVARRQGSEGAPLRGDRLDVLRTLHAVAPEPGSPLLLVVDQFEELATQTATRAERERFVANLVEVAEEPAPGITVLLTVRADFFDRVLHDPSLGQLALDGLVGVVPLTPVELEAAAVAPARGEGISLEPELIAELVADMTDQPGALPLFEYALTETFDRRRGTTLTRADYRAVGGIAGALARRAEQAFAALEEEERAAARQVFLRLVTLGPGGRATRRRVARRHLESLAGAGVATTTAIDAFDRARLLTLDREPAGGEVTVELAHEALIGSWPRFAQWLQETRDDLRLQQALAAEVAAWQTHGRSPDYLATGARLDAYRDWPAPGSVVPTSAETEFLELSHAEHARLARLRRRRGRQLRGLVAAMTAVALVASVLLGMTVRRGERLEAAAQAAQARNLANASVAQIGVDAELSLLLALEAQRMADASGSPVPEAVGALHRAVVGNRVVDSFSEASDVAFLPDGRVVVAGRTTQVVDPTGRVDSMVLDSDQTVVSAAASPDGRRIATGTSGARLTLWDATTGRRIESFPAAELPGYVEGGPEVSGLAFDGTGERLASVGAYGWGLDVWSVEAGTVDERQAFVGGYTRGVVFSHDGSRVLAAGGVGVAALESDGTWTPLIDAAVTDLVAIPDGGMATTAADGWVRTWDDAGSPTGRFSSGSTSLVSLAATPDGRRLVAGGADGRVHVWTMDDGGTTPRMSFRGAGRSVTALAVDPTGERVAGVDAAGMAFIWDTRDVLPGEFGSWPAHGAVAVSPDGGLLAVTEEDGRQVSARTLPEGHVMSTMTVPDNDGVVTPVVGLTFSASGTDIVATTRGAEGRERVMLQAWDAQSGRATASEKGDVPVEGAAAVAADGSEIAVPTCNDLVRSGHPPTVLETPAGVTVRTTWGCWRAVDLSDDGTAVAAQTALGEVTVWDVASLRGQGWLGSPAPRILTVHHTPATTGSVAFSPDETALLTAGVDGTARVWAVPSGETLLVLDAGGGPVESARWTADGSRIVTSSHDGVPRLWDARSGALLAELPVHGTWPHLAVTPDGARLLTSADGVVRVWTLDTDELTAIAESTVGRVLTGAERTRYGISN